MLLMARMSQHSPSAATCFTHTKQKHCDKVGAKTRAAECSVEDKPFYCFLLNDSMRIFLLLLLIELIRGLDLQTFAWTRC